jgi:hypothetical protein
MDYCHFEWVSSARYSPWFLLALAQGSIMAIRACAREPNGYQRLRKGASWLSALAQGSLMDTCNFEWISSAGYSPWFLLALAHGSLMARTGFSVFNLPSEAIQLHCGCVPTCTSIWRAGCLTPGASEDDERKYWSDCWGSSVDIWSGNSKAITELVITFPTCNEIARDTLEIQVDPDGFSRCCVTLRVTGFLNFVHRPEF